MAILLLKYIACCVCVRVAFLQHMYYGPGTGLAEAEGRKFAHLFLMKGEALVFPVLVLNVEF